MTIGPRRWWSGLALAALAAASFAGAQPVDIGAALRDAKDPTPQLRDLLPLREI